MPTAPTAFPTAVMVGVAWSGPRAGPGQREECGSGFGGMRGCGMAGTHSGFGAGLRPADLDLWLKTQPGCGPGSPGTLQKSGPLPRAMGCSRILRGERPLKARLSGCMLWRCTQEPEKGQQLQETSWEGLSEARGMTRPRAGGGRVGWIQGVRGSGLDRATCVGGCGGEEGSHLGSGWLWLGVSGSGSWSTGVPLTEADT